MLAPTNYIVDTNRFKLAGPPAWWLHQLHAFDDSLVVIPSRQDYVYRLAQRRKLNLPAQLVNDLLFKESDTRMLARYGLVPVTSILATANWSNPCLFEELRRRAPWRLGGAKKVTDQLEAQEQQDELRTSAQTDEQLTDRSKDGWKYYQTKLGVRGTVDLGARQPRVSPPPRLRMGG